MITRDERQSLGVQKWVDNRCCGTLEYATGVGKTRTAIKAINRFLARNPGKRVMIVVPTEPLQRQWTLVLAEFNVFTNSTVEIINTVVKHEWECDLLIIDEIHMMAADTFGRIFTKVKYGMILGLTATMERLDGKHVYIQQYCPIVDRISIIEATENKWLSPYKEYKVILEVDLEEYQEINNEFYNHFAFFNYDFDTAMKCAGSDGWKARNEYADKMCTDKNKIKEMRKIVTAHAFGFMSSMSKRKAFIHNHPKKIEIANYILEHRPMSKAITFSPTIKVAEKIKYGYVCHSKQTKAKRAMTLEEFNKVEQGVINTSKALDVGADIQGLNLAIILCNTSSKTQKTQRIGRAIRFAPNKESEVFTLVLKGTVEEEWFRKSTEGKKYYTIDEEGLKRLLNGEEFTLKRDKQTGMTFRF